METVCEVKDGIRNILIDFDKDSPVKYEFIASTHDDDPLVDETYGALIYVNTDDPMHSLKIYKDYSDFIMAVKMGCTKYVPGTHNNERDFIKKLQFFQDKIKLTRFPTGIVTYHDYIIGQEIPFYKDCINLLNACQKANHVEEIIALYIKCLEIIKELYDNGIVYFDVHMNNFIVNKDNNVNLIDFDSDYVFSSRYKEKCICCKNNRFKT